MEFRMLSDEEMKLFDDDFKHYLIVNGVSNEEWLDVNKNNPEKAHQIVAVFSDVIFQKTYEKIQFLEFRSKGQLLVFSCEKEQIHLIGLKGEEKEFDFTTPQSIQNSILKHAAKIKHFKQSKSYAKKREIELFEMAENGCLASTQAFWSQIIKLTSA